MYHVYPASKRVNKEFNCLSKTERDELVDDLENHPKNTGTGKKNGFRCKNLTNGWRVLFRVADKEKIVEIFKIGSHKDYEIFLKTFKL